MRAHIPTKNVRPIFEPLWEPVGVSAGDGSGLWASHRLPARPGLPGEQEHRGAGRDHVRSDRRHGHRQRSGEDRRHDMVEVAYDSVRVGNRLLLLVV